MLVQRVEVLKKAIPQVTELLQNIISYLAIIDQDLDKVQKEHDDTYARVQAMHDEEREIDRKRQELQGLEGQRQQLQEERDIFEQEKTEVVKEKSILKERKIGLDLLEQRLNEKMTKVNRILQE